MGLSSVTYHGEFINFMHFTTVEFILKYLLLLYTILFHLLANVTFIHVLSFNIRLLSPDAHYTAQLPALHMVYTSNTMVNLVDFIFKVQVSYEIYHILSYTGSLSIRSSNEPMMLITEALTNDTNAF